MNAMTADQITAIVNANKGEMAEVRMTNGDTVTGSLISINSKGVNVKDENGTTISRGLNRVARVDLIEIDNDQDIFEDAADVAIAATDPEVYSDDEPGTEMDALAAELDGATTAELAEMFGIAAKELRVTLRALGMGVGKGQRYHLKADQIKTVKAALTA